MFRGKGKGKEGVGVGWDGRGRGGSQYANGLAIRSGRLFVYAELKNKAIAGLVGWALVYACKPSEG